MPLKMLVGLLSLALLSGCYYVQKLSNPIGVIEYISPALASDSKHNRQLMVLLPGIGDRAAIFAQQGVVEAVRRQNPNTDVIAVEAHFKYYQARTLVERLSQDIIKPARAAGYRQIYLGGVSLGGFGSLLYLKHYPDDITKIFILAPYLGDEQDYSYLAKQTAPPQNPRDVNIWAWLTQLPESTKNKIYLAYGADDKFALPNGLLAQLLPDDHVVVQAGQHNWNTWAALWPRLLAK